MADDAAMSFRRNRNQPPPAAEQGENGLSTLWLVVGALAVGFAGYAFLANGGIGGGLMGLMRSAPPASVAAAPPVNGPRVMAAVPGIRETVSASVTGMSPSGTQQLALTYLPVGPVVLRTERAFVEIDGPRLILPPIGPQRTSRAVIDHGIKLANELRALAFTPCDKHLRYLAAANINLFVGSFMTPRTPIQTSAAPNTAFWLKTEASTIRRTVHELAEKGALAPFDFGLDTSPEVKGLFDGVRLGQPTCQ